MLRNTVKLANHVSMYTYVHYTLDREIFTLKIIHIKKFCVEKFSQFHSIREIFLTVNGYNMEEDLESSDCLVYYQISGEPGITGCSYRSDIYLGGCGLRAHAYSLIIDT